MISFLFQAGRARRRAALAAVMLLAGWVRADPALPSLMVVQPGDLPIILSAPHGGLREIPGVPKRIGKGIAQFQTVTDSRTDELATQIAANLSQLLGARPYLVVAQFARSYVDANRPPEEAYESPAAKSYYDGYQQAVRAACERVREEWGGGLLVDVHGQKARVETIFRGTADGQTDRHLRQAFGEAAITGPNSLLGQLAQRGYKIFPPDGSSDRENPSFDGGYIVRTYGSREGGTIDAIQLESGSDLRKPARLPQTARDYAAAIAAFARAYLPKAKLAAAPPAP